MVKLNLAKFSSKHFSRECHTKFASVSQRYRITNKNYRMTGGFWLRMLEELGSELYLGDWTIESQPPEL